MLLLFFCFVLNIIILPKSHTECSLHILTTCARSNGQIPMTRSAPYTFLHCSTRPYCAPANWSIGIKSTSGWSSDGLSRRQSVSGDLEKKKKKKKNRHFIVRLLRYKQKREYGHVPPMHGDKEKKNIEESHGHKTIPNTKPKA